MRHLLLAAAIAGVIGQAQEPAGSAGVLRQAEIRLILHATYATVVADYTIDRDGDPLVFEAVRLPGQVVLVQGALGPDYALQQVQRVETRQLIAPTGSGTELFRVRYTVEGDLARIPLFLPRVEIPADAALGLTVIAPPDSALDKAYPRLERQPDGTLFAALHELPDALVLTPGRQPWSLGHVLLWVVPLLAVVAIAYAMTRAARKRKTATRIPGNQ